MLPHIKSRKTTIQTLLKKIKENGLYGVFFESPHLGREVACMPIVSDPVCYADRLEMDIELRLTPHQAIEADRIFYQDKAKKLVNLKPDPTGALSHPEDYKLVGYDLRIEVEDVTVKTCKISKQTIEVFKAECTHLADGTEEEYSVTFVIADREAMYFLRLFKDIDTMNKPSTTNLLHLFAHRGATGITISSVTHATDSGVTTLHALPELRVYNDNEYWYFQNDTGVVKLSQDAFKYTKVIHANPKRNIYVIQLHARNSVVELFIG